MLEALAAVMVPSFLKTGRKEGTLSTLTLLKSSSVSITNASPRRCGTSTGTTSSENLPAAQDSALRL